MRMARRSDGRPGVADDGGRRGERRLPMALAVLVAGGLYAVLPSQFRISAAIAYGYEAALVVLLLVLIVGDPGRIDRDRPWLRAATIVMVSVITAATAAASIRLVVLILGPEDFASASVLLVGGGIVWASIVIAFALWYWILDSGGPVARAHGTGRSLPAFRFPEHDLDGPSYAGWYPQFVDYLALSFNTSTSFGPTDVSAVRHWSKLWLMTESAISLALIGLVVASAVNQL